MDDRREAFYQDRLQKSGPRYPGFDRLSAEIALSFLHTYDLLHQQMSRLMSGYGLSKSTVNVLMLLRHGPQEGMQLHDLGELLLVSRANVTGLIDHLEERGYVRRVVDTQDRRARFARITKSAELLLDEYMPLHYGNLKTLLLDLSGEQKTALIGLLRQMRHSITTHSSESSEELSPGIRNLAN